MNLTFANRGFNTHARERDAISFRDYGVNDTTISFKRTAPKRTKDFVGMEKTEVKHTLIDPATGQTLGIQTVSTSILATASADQRSFLNAVTKAVVADPVYDQLIQDQRLPD